MYIPPQPPADTLGKWCCPGIPLPSEQSSFHGRPVHIWWGPEHWDIPSVNAVRIKGHSHLLHLHVHIVLLAEWWKRRGVAWILSTVLMHCESWNIGEGIPWGYSQSWCFNHPQNSFVPLYCCYVWLSLTPFPPYTLRQLLDLWMAIYSLWDHQATHKSHADHNSGTPGELVIVSTMPNCCVYGLCTLTPQLSPYQTISDRRLSN